MNDRVAGPMLQDTKHYRKRGYIFEVVEEKSEEVEKLGKMCFVCGVKCGIHDYDGLPKK